MLIWQLAGCGAATAYAAGNGKQRCVLLLPLLLLPKMLQEFPVLTHEVDSHPTACLVHSRLDSQLRQGQTSS